MFLAVLLALHPSPTSGWARAPREVTVTANDYAFMPLPAIEAGPTIFGFVNQGTVSHEVAIARLKAATTLAEFVKSTPGPTRAALIERSVGILIAGPGKSPDGKLLVDLIRGATYVVLCNLRDNPGAPQHMTLGMYTSFTPK